MRCGSNIIIQVMMMMIAFTEPFLYRGQVNIFVFLFLELVFLSVSVGDGEGVESKRCEFSMFCCKQNTCTPSMCLCLGNQNINITINSAVLTLWGVWGGGSKASVMF